MNPTVKSIAVLAMTAAALGAATFFILPHLRTSPEPRATTQEAGAPDGGADETDEAADPRGKKDPRSAQTTVRKNTKSLAERNQAKFDVGEMRNEAADWIQRFRGTPEERRKVTEELRDDTELILMITAATESSIENMTPDELERERVDFEKNYRPLLDYLKTGRLQRMLKTPEEQEVIGTAFEAAQNFLERLDAALNAVGY
jgi:hypothetical protein